MRRNNPFRFSYLGIVAVCFVVVGAFFVCISQITYKTEQKRFYQEKTEVLLREFENQMQLMEDTSLRVATNYEFQPYFFKGKIEKELSMLDSFAQYKYTLPVVDNYFLFYGDSYIYRSADSTLDFDFYLEKSLQDEMERTDLRKEMENLKEGFDGIWNRGKILSFSEKLYVLLPFRVKFNSGFGTAILDFLFADYL